MPKALCIVAHPDDCVIFGYHYILANRQFEWTIAYLILDDDSPRVEEMRGYWKRHSIDVFSLALPHDPPPADITNRRCSIPYPEAKRRIEETAGQYDHLLTHGKEGEYGHPHHVFLHRIVEELGRGFVAFDIGPSAPLRCSWPRDEQESLPLHGRAIRRFVREYGLETSAGYRLQGSAP